jgi:predicted Zn-dependent protease
LVLTLSGGTDANVGLAVLNSVVDAHPNMLDGRYHLAKAYMKRNQPDSAIPVLNETLDRIKKMEEGGETVSPKIKADVQAALNEAKGTGGTAAGR